MVVGSMVSKVPTPCRRGLGRSCIEKVEAFNSTNDDKRENKNQCGSSLHGEKENKSFLRRGTWSQQIQKKCLSAAHSDGHVARCQVHNLPVSRRIVSQEQNSFVELIPSRTSASGKMNKTS